MLSANHSEARLVRLKAIRSKQLAQNRYIAPIVYGTLATSLQIRAKRSTSLWLFHVFLFSNVADRNKIILHI